jgi:hypothetical protein
VRPVQATLVRLLLAALAVAAIAVGATSLRNDHRCADVRAQARTAPAGALGPIGTEVIARCGDPRDRAIVALVLVNRGHRREAIDVTRRMTQTTPDDYIGWLALWRLTDERAALVRAHRLNPRGTPTP